ncbi:MAG: HEAT repeat domain-containing protein [Deltaproteobacteria bacterium]|nr:MAG: HEAT repeat domain-containing protein [Deltaproteobacteria bacterium]
MAEIQDERADRLTNAISELAKALKAVNFYPEGHPSLKKILTTTVRAFEAIPVPEEGLEVEVTREGLSAFGKTVPEKHLAISDLRNALFLRRTQKLIFLQGMVEDELEEFLKCISLDPKDILKEGGLEDILASRRITHIWVNRVDYEKITEKLKEEKEEEMETEGDLLLLDDSLDLADELGQGEEMNPLDLLPQVSPDEEDINLLIETLARTTSPSSYRDLLLRSTRIIKEMMPAERLEYTERIYRVFTRHVEYPPEGDEEIRKLARTGIKELGDDDVVAHYVKKFRSRSIQERGDAEIVLGVLGEKSVRPLLDALTEEGDLVTRRAIVDLVIKIGEKAIPDIIAYLEDSRWFVVRNMLTILGSMNNPDVAPYVVNCLSHEDPRVQKEAIKALSKIPGPLAIKTLGEYCFHENEDLACLAITALASKREEKAVEILHERFLTKKFLFPDARPTREIIEALRAIGTDGALEVLRRIALYRSIITPKRVKDFKVHAVETIGKFRSQRALEIIEELSKSSDGVVREAALRILKRKRAASG